MKLTTNRVGGWLLPLFALLPACAGNVADGSDDATASSQSAVSAAPTPEIGVANVEGRATALQVLAGVALPGLAVGAAVEVSDTGPLPAAGGSRSVDLAVAEAAGIVATGVLDASTESSRAHDGVRSSSSVDELAIRIPGLVVTANVLTSNAIATCEPQHASLDGGADIVGLTINGLAVVVTGFPNQTIDLGVAKIVINEVTETPRWSVHREVRVAALHVTALDVADVVVSAASAGVTCNTIVEPGIVATGG